MQGIDIADFLLCVGRIGDFAPADLRQLFQRERTGQFKKAFIRHC